MSLYRALLLVVVVSAGVVVLDGWPRGFGVEPWVLVALYGGVALAVAGSALRGLRGGR